MLDPRKEETLSASVKGVLDRLMAGTATEEDIAAEIRREIYSGLKEYCSIPAGFEHCKLGVKEIDIDGMHAEDIEDLLQFPPGEIVNPEYAHREALEFLRMLEEGDRMVCRDGNRLHPDVGAFFYGPPGTAKTHLMVAYAKLLHGHYRSYLDKIEAEVASIVKDLFEKFSNSPGAALSMEGGQGRYSLDNGVLRESSPAMEFQRGLQRLKDRIAGWPVKPTDFLYLDFDQLVEFYRSEKDRPEVIEAITNARVVFVDDVHPKNDPARAQVIQHIIERRYNAGRPATFLTSNLDIKELGGGDDKIASRLESRCKEMLFTVDFDGCKDWRTLMKARKISLIREAVRARIAERTGIQPPSAEGQLPAAEGQ